jgi:hypothetical protein
MIFPRSDSMPYYHIKYREISCFNREITGAGDVCFNKCHVELVPHLILNLGIDFSLAGNVTKLKYSSRFCISSLMLSEITSCVYCTNTDILPGRWKHRYLYSLL